MKDPNKIFTVSFKDNKEQHELHCNYQLLQIVGHS